ncbi:hypothetical protein [Reinekea sp.]|uniref:hypothetical protein n=1 Tax=Reinekea sp. TaxID=1970455 RepID=UPI003989F0C8
MSTQTQIFQSKSIHQGLPSSQTERADMIVEQAKLADVFYVPNMNALMAVSQSELDQIVSISDQYNDLIRELIDAQNQFSKNPNDKAAKNKVDAVKAKVDKSISSVMSGSGLDDTAWMEIHRIHSSRDIYYAPGKIINLQDPNKSRNFYFLVDDNVSPDDVARLKNEDGTLNDNAFKDAFSQAVANIKLEIISESGQFSTKHLAGAFSPILAELFEEKLESLDDYITTLNETLKISWRQHDAKKKKVVELLESDPLVLQDFGHAQKLCGELWEADSPMRGRNYNDLSGSNSNEAKSRLVDKIRRKQTPPAYYDASASANLMRWKSGLGITGEFDLKKGVLAGEVKAEMDVALAEGKLTGSVYFPHDRGFHVKPNVPVIRRSSKWAEFTNGIPERLHFDVNSEFLFLEDIVELASVLSHFGILKKLLTNDRYKLSIIGHASLTGSKQYNEKISARRAQMVYGLLTRNAKIWLNSFNQKHWNDHHREYMRKAITNHSNINLNSSLSSDEALIHAYFSYCERYLARVKLILPLLIPQEFAQQYMVALGESTPLINTESETRLNRRVEFVLLELVETVAKNETEALDLGRFRLQLEGQVGGWAGLTVGLAAKLELNSQKGQLTIGRNPASASANASAFAGAKVEAGLTGSLDWSQPEKTTPDFNTLGSVGYMLSGYAGIGGEADFTIGFDRDIQRFLVRVKSSLCVGYGAGGQIEFTVDAKNVWSFIKLVHEQLLKVDFSFVDIFAKDAYNHFIAWSYELIKNGYYFQGNTMKIGLEAANLAVNIFVDTKNIVDDFIDANDSFEDIDKLINSLEQSSVEISLAPPEVKGRILFVLVNSPAHLLKELSISGFAEKRERAVLHLLQVGVRTVREFQEVLEHMHGKSVNGRSESKKCDDAALAQQKLVDFLSDSEDERWLRKWWNGLDNPSNCGCLNPELNQNPLSG